MKNIIYILIAITFSTSSCSKRNIVLTENNIPEDIFYLENDLKPYTGKCTIYYQGTESVKEIMNFKNGILNGLHISYYKNGQIKRTGSYENGYLDGKWTSYDPSGKKIYEVEYKNDTLIGRFISWYSTGVIREKGVYKDNQKVGEWLSYDESGMIVKKVLL
jgi:antitoxin component YwqK of YwqJK toxin-antitoxin module